MGLTDGDDGTTLPVTSGSLPEGNYRIVGWDVDTTGPQVNDEICQLAAYTSDSQYSQYIMPHANLKVRAEKRHNLRVITMYLYRMLTDLKTSKVIKTKSEVSAMIDFLTWLEGIRGDDTDGIILVSYEERKLAPSLLLEAMRRYSLMDRFCSIVKGFANSYSLAKEKCAELVKSFNLGTLSRVLLDKNEYLGNAAVRAKLCYLIIQHLGQSEREDLEKETKLADQPHTIELIRSFAINVDTEEKELAEFKAQLARQNTLRPIFSVLMYDESKRQYYSKLRSLLVKNNLDMEKVQIAWDNEGSQGLNTMLNIHVSNGKPDELAELLEILDCYMDPAKKQIKPKRKGARTNGKKKSFKKKDPRQLEDQSQAASSENRDSSGHDLEDSCNDVEKDNTQSNMVTNIIPKSNDVAEDTVPTSDKFDAPASKDTEISLQ